MTFDVGRLVSYHSDEELHAELIAYMVVPICEIVATAEAAFTSVNLTQQEVLFHLPWSSKT